MRISNKSLLQVSEINKKLSLNGISKYSNEISIYTPNEIFKCSSPQFSKDMNHSYWDIGYIDIRKMIFLEIGIMKNQPSPRLSDFLNWINFLQTVIDDEVYSRLFETFGFSESILLNNDRLLHEPEFFKSIRRFLLSKEFFREDKNNDFSDFLMVLCDLFKNSRNLVSFVIFKKKILSNLKNFKIN